MKKFLALAALSIVIASCSPEQLAKVDSFESKIRAACEIATALAPFAPGVAPWIVGGCATEAGIAKLIRDSGSLVWLNDLILKAQRERAGLS